MDEGLSRAVREVFVNLYEKGLIYKGNRIINWCPKCTTRALRRRGRVHRTTGHFWHIRYPVKGSDGEYVTIATTRPRRCLAIPPWPSIRTTSAISTCRQDADSTAGGPRDSVIADEYVEKDFGTAA